MTFQSNPKPEPHAKVKARQKRQDAARRTMCVEQVWQRDRACCVLCGRPVRRTEAAYGVFDVGHVDEILPKSLGGDPGDVNNCRLLCPKCHFSGPSGAHRTTVRPETD